MELSSQTFCIHLNLPIYLGYCLLLCVVQYLLQVSFNAILFNPEVCVNYLMATVHYKMATWFS